MNRSVLMEKENTQETTIVADPMLFMKESLHSSRNMVMSMRGYAELIRHFDDETIKHGEWAGKIVQQLDRMNELYTRLECICRPGSGRKSVQLASNLLRSSEALVRSRIADAGRDVHCSVKIQNDGWIRGNGEEISEAFAAIVQNAVEASEEGGKVQIVSRKHSHGGVEIMIRDGGCGMSTDVLARVGQPFFSRKSNHLGLGIYMSKLVFERHGFHLGFESKPGNGTMARIIARDDAIGGNR